MIINVGFIVNESQMTVKSLNTDKKTMADKRIDLISLPEESIDALFYKEALLDNNNISHILDKEQKFYPLYNFESLSLSADDLEAFDYDQVFDIYQKAAARWILNNNLKSIEQAYPTLTYLKDLYIKDRNSFFEELWFILKQNLATQDLNIIFHDLKEPTEKQAEKGEKPKLCYSYVQGNKLPNLFAGKDKEALIMQEYEKEFTNFFNITDFNKEKGQLIACAKIGLSPVLLMANIPSFNQLQQSVLISLFTGLQES
jgi:hypothetical protein